MCCGAKLCKSIDREELINDPRFVTNALRTENQRELKPLLEERLREKSTDAWRVILDEAGVPNGPINSIDQVVVDEQVIAREMIVEVDHPKAGKTMMPRRSD